jgi:multiple sugar transport system substrate-binding protein
MHTPHLPALSRRTLLRTLAAGTGAAGAAGALAGCGGDLRGTRDDGWRRYAGTTITFGGENAAPTAAIKADIAAFTELTGIDVRIATFDITSWAQVASLDSASGSGQYDVIYADPWMSLPVLAPGLVDLREFLEDSSLPQPDPGLDDFHPMMLEVEGRFGEEDPLYTLPYDSPTLLLHYRQDLFEKYHDQMSDSLGFDPTPGPDLTWDQYRQVGAFFNEHVDEVDYGIGLMARQHDSLSCEFSNLLWAYGGDFFSGGEELGLVGAVDPGSCILGDDRAQEAAAMLAALHDVAHPASLSWDWDSTSAALRGGSIAMCTNWHENAAGNEASMPGKIGYAVMPTGPERSANMFGGTGIGINAASSGDRRGAAWLFLTWATSPEVQLRGLKSSVGGGTPTRLSVYDKPEVKAAQKRPSDAPNMLAGAAVKQAWEPEHRGLRPKIPMWQEALVAYYTGLSTMLVDGTSPTTAMPRIASAIDTITARGWKA